MCCLTQLTLRGGLQLHVEELEVRQEDQQQQTLRKAEALKAGS